MPIPPPTDDFDDDAFDAAMRARHHAALSHLSAPVQRALRTASHGMRAVTGTTRARWHVPAFGAALAAVAIVAVVPRSPSDRDVVEAKTIADARRAPPDPVASRSDVAAVPRRIATAPDATSAPSPAATADAGSAVALDTAAGLAAELDEHPDFLLWLAADAAEPTRS